MKMERGHPPAADLNGIGQCGGVESEEEDQDYHLYLESDSNEDNSVELQVDRGASMSGQMVSGGAMSTSGAQQQEQGSQQQNGNQHHQGCQQKQGSQPPEKGEEYSACIRVGCPNQAVPNSEWEDEYCSNECVVSHCRDVFASWVASNQGSAQSYNTVK